MPRPLRLVVATVGVLLGVAALFALVVWRSSLIGDYGTMRAAKTRHPPVSYRGDGKFVDTGPEAGIDRFVVDLGDVDLTSDGRYSCELRGLPKAHFVAHLRVATPLVYSRADRPQTGWGLTKVQLQLHETDELVFDVNRPLNEWIWSGPIDSQYSMLYLLDGGFDASPNTTFRLVVTISNAAAVAPKARLVVTGGGWQDYMTNELYRRGT